MLLILTSPSAICAPNGQVHESFVDVLKRMKASGSPVAVISNRDEPGWFKSVFNGTGVQFLKAPGRQDGNVIKHNVARFKVEPYDTLVIAANQEDVQMGKNSGSTLIAAGWTNDPKVDSLGIKVGNANDLQEVFNLTAGWSGGGWFESTNLDYQVRALTDLSSYKVATDQIAFSKKVTTTVKGGGTLLMALLTVASRSLLRNQIQKQEDLMWGVYPSSSSANDDSEVLSDFTHRLRTTVSRVRYAERGNPLFIRHSPSPKRHLGGGGDRMDPTIQIETIHLNKRYEGRVKGRNVIVIDDCMTYGVSFGVAAAILKQAGAKSVLGMAIGKFGRQLRHYDINIHGDPFKPIKQGDYTIKSAAMFPGQENANAQEILRNLIK